MRIAGFLLLLAGWGIVLSAIALLRSSSPIASFVTAGTGVEVLGLVLVIRSHRLLRRERK
jgi:divalent metal cation (Fe/Co/Zn/Cd) transporter